MVVSVPDAEIENKIGPAEMEPPFKTEIQGMVRRIAGCILE